MTAPYSTLVRTYFLAADRMKPEDLAQVVALSIHAKEEALNIAEELDMHAVFAMRDKALQQLGEMEAYTYADSEFVARLFEAYAHRAKVQAAFIEIAFDALERYIRAAMQQEEVGK